MESENNKEALIDTEGICFENNKVKCTRCHYLDVEVLVDELRESIIDCACGLGELSGLLKKLNETNHAIFELLIDINRKI